VDADGQCGGASGHEMSKFCNGPVPRRRHRGFPNVQCSPEKCLKVEKIKESGGGEAERNIIGRKLELVENFRGGDVAECDWLDVVCGW